MFAEDDVPKEQRYFVHIYAEAAIAWTARTEKKPAPATAAHWAQIKGKRALQEMA
jgi:ferredoxin